MPQLPTLLSTSNPTPQRTTHGYDPTPLYRSEEQAAAGIEKVGQQIVGVADDFKQKEDADAILDAQARENAAQRKAMDYLYAPDTGILNKKGADALGAGKDADTYLQSLRAEQMANVTNPTAQRALSKSFDSISNSVKETVMRHESQERTQYAGALAQQSADNSRDAVGLQYNDDNLFEKSKTQTLAAVNAQGKIDGLPTDERAKSAVSGLWKTRISAALNSTDPATIAQGGQYYTQAQASGELTFADSEDLGHTLKVILPKAQAQTAFNADYAHASATEVPTDTVFAAMRMQESGGKQTGGAGSVMGPNDPTTSPKGAIGVMQIMPGTGPEAAKLAGVPWDENKFKTDAGYNTQLGQAYFTMLKNKYGDNRMALAAYNMGPGYVDDLVNGTNESGKNAAKTKTGADFGAFIAHAPAETQNYVAKIMGQAATVNGPPQMDLAAAQTKAATMPSGVGDNYLAMVTAHNTQVTAAQVQQQNDVLSKIQPILEQSNGNISAVPPALLAQASKAGVLDKVRAYKGYTDEGFKNYLDSLDTDAFSNVDMSDPSIRLRLSASDYDTYSKKQTEMVNDPKNVAMSRRVDDAVNYVFQTQLGKTLPAMDSTDKKDMDLKAKILRFKALMQSNIQDKYTETGKVPSSADVFKIADTVITSQVSVPGGGWFGFAADKSASDVTIADVPDYARKAIEQARIQRNLPVTESGVLSDYLRGLKQAGKT